MKVNLQVKEVGKHVDQNSGRDRTSSKSSASRSPGGRRKFDRSSKGKLCVDFLKNKCTRGADCKYVHDKPSDSVERRNRTKPNSASSTSDTRREDTPVHNSSNNDREVQICFDFARTGQCNFGDKCRFAHSNPSDAAAGPVKPQASAANRTSNSPAPEDPFR